MILGESPTTVSLVSASIGGPQAVLMLPPWARNESTSVAAGGTPARHCTESAEGHEIVTD